MIDDIVYTYHKQRMQFGRPPFNPQEESKPAGGIAHDESRKALYVKKDPKTLTLGNIPEYSEHGVILSPSL